MFMADPPLFQIIPFNDIKKSRPEFNEAAEPSWCITAL